MSLIKLNNKPILKYEKETTDTFNKCSVLHLNSFKQRKKLHIQYGAVISVLAKVPAFSHDILGLIMSFFCKKQKLRRHNETPLYKYIPVPYRTMCRNVYRYKLSICKRLLHTIKENSKNISRIQEEIDNVNKKRLYIPEYSDEHANDISSQICHLEKKKQLATLGIKFNHFYKQHLDILQQYHNAKVKSIDKIVDKNAYKNSIKLPTCLENKQVYSDDIVFECIVQITRLRKQLNDRLRLVEKKRKTDCRREARKKSRAKATEEKQILRESIAKQESIDYFNSLPKRSIRKKK